VPLLGPLGEPISYVEPVSYLAQYVAQAFRPACDRRPKGLRYVTNWLRPFRLLASAMAALALVAASRSIAQDRPDFSGTWSLDRARNGPARDVWGQNRPQRFVISHTPSEFSVDTGDGSIVGTTVTLLYKLDGSPIVVLDTSLGEVTGFTRKIRTEASWDDNRLVTRTTHFAEKAVAPGRPSEIVRGGITRILTFALSSDTNEMVVERTGLRELPPAQLHGRPYRQEDDLVYARDSAIYTRVTP